MQKTWPILLQCLSKFFKRNKGTLMCIFSPVVFCLWPKWKIIMVAETFSLRLWDLWHCFVKYLWCLFVFYFYWELNLSLTACLDVLRHATCLELSMWHNAIWVWQVQRPCWIHQNTHAKVTYGRGARKSRHRVPLHSGVRTWYCLVTWNRNARLEGGKAQTWHCL